MVSELSWTTGHPAGVGELLHVGIGCGITETCFTSFSSLPTQSRGCTPQRFPVSPGGQPALSCSCRPGRRTSCRSASGRAYTPPRGTSWYHCTLPGMPSASFPYSWYQLGHPTAGHKARLATQNSQAAPPPPPPRQTSHVWPHGVLISTPALAHLFPLLPTWNPMPT